MNEVNIDVLDLNVEAVGGPEQKVEELKSGNYPHSFYLDYTQRASRNENADLIAEVEDDKGIGEHKFIFTFRLHFDNLVSNCNW